MNFTIAWLFVILDVFSIMLCDAAEKPVSGVKNGWGSLKNNKIFLALRF